MDVGELKRRVAEDRKDGFAPFMVVGTAGTTATRVIDLLPELWLFCQEAGLWFHVDAAWDGSAIVSPKLRRHLEESRQRIPSPVTHTNGSRFRWGVNGPRGYIRVGLINNMGDEAILAQKSSHSRSVTRFAALETAVAISRGANLSGVCTAPET
jgi:hypothetical protein